MNIQNNYSINSQLFAKNRLSEQSIQKTPANEIELTQKEKKEVEELKSLDKKVRRHENEHKAAAGDLATGQPKFKYELGPDGEKYAVSGEVQIDTSEVINDPEATIKKAKRIKKAALAPAEPSSQDKVVAKKAALMESKAKEELKKQEKENSTPTLTLAYSQNNNENSSFSVMM